jgi:hypothetical protein
MRACPDSAGRPYFAFFRPSGAFSRPLSDFVRQRPFRPASRVFGARAADRAAKAAEIRPIRLDAEAAADPLIYPIPAPISRLIARATQALGIHLSLSYIAPAEIRAISPEAFFFLYARPEGFFRSETSESASSGYMARWRDSARSASSLPEISVISPYSPAEIQKNFTRAQ